jgi:hypothetical protein
MSRTTIQQHKQSGKKLLPPLAQMGISNSSWQHERLPHMLWATVLIANLPRADALQIFRKVAEACIPLPETVYPDVSHYGLAQMPSEHSKRLMAVAGANSEIRDLLSSMLVYEDLPGKAEWTEVLKGAKSNQPDMVLMRAVGATLWHQTQEATDCRWCRMLPLVLTRRMQMPEVSFREIVGFPNEGDMRRVRPMVRAEEMSIAGFEAHIGQAEKRAVWAVSFWQQNLRDYPCFALLRDEQIESKPTTTLARVDEVYAKLIGHNLKTCSYTGVDAKHDTTFGMALYGLSIVRELLCVGNTNAVVGRLGLRTLLECFVTLAYLIYKNKPDLWKSHRVFGAGQAKLSCLKLEELKSDKCFADVDVLKEIANEDIWEEFLPINQGHWEEGNLRREAVEAGMKPDYDKYYAWASTFAHAHWGAVRESVFHTCVNPLHRLHRVPRPHRKALPDVIPDACELADKILELLSRTYPDFPHRITLRTP